MHEFEKKIVKIFKLPKSEFLDSLSAVISNIYLLVIVWITVCIFLIIRDSFVGLFICFGLAITFMIHILISEIIFKWGGKKISFKRLRPCKSYPDEIKAIGKSDINATSFPSSHMAGLTGGFFILAYFYKIVLPISIIAIIIMAWSRLRNGMHYPSDILAGVILGLFYGYLALEILKIF